MNDITRPGKIDFLMKYDLKICQMRFTTNTNNICTVFENLTSIV